MDFPILYHQGKKEKMYQWHLSTEGADIVTEYGLVDGEKQTTRKACTAKNVGKKNEVSPEDQAVKEAKSMHKHKLDRKYSLTQTDAKETVFLPMLAGDFEKAKKKVEYPVCVQPKLDGLRCLAFWEGKRCVKLLSRGGKDYNIPHLAQELANILPYDMVFDGEIYVHEGPSLQQINKLVKKERTEPDPKWANLLTSDLEYWVYDCFCIKHPKLAWVDRAALRSDIFGHTQDEQKNVIHVKHDIASNEGAIYKMMADFVQDGYEGAIVRALDGEYELGHRSRKLLKVKKFKDAEYEITGFYEGKGRYTGCVTWVCKTDDDKEFHCCPKGTLEQKKDWFNRGKEYVGSMLKVKYFQLTDDGIPQFPVGLAIRLPEDM